MTRTWSQADREEHERACGEAWESAESTRERALQFLHLVNDAAQAHRPWALGLLDEFMESGAAAELKRWRKASRPVMAVAPDGRLLSRARVVGVARRDSDGQRFYQQEAFDFLGWGEIEQKIIDWRTQISAYGDNAYIFTLVLELRDLAPGTATPDEAARALGTTVDAWLDQRTAA